MKNKEKWAKELAEIALANVDIAFDVRSGRPMPCVDLQCKDCKFCYGSALTGLCSTCIMKWAEEEYIEKPKISRSDRVFLDYVPDYYKYMARDKDGTLFTYKDRPQKRSKTWIDTSELFAIYKAKVGFPMVKWEDKEPWLIEDLKKLEVVDEY